ncbi:MAG TPA: SIMPL domain-containing protein [Candidatus Solibacter sp.]|nr:SIMPL domain-containing protein [Candidatus Solibacter sp.]
MTAAQSIEGIAVVGEAVRRMAPESAEFVIELSTTAYSAAQAMKEHQARSGQIAQAVAQFGVQRNDLQTISLNVVNLFTPLTAAMQPALPPYAPMPQLGGVGFASPETQFGSYQVRNVLRVTVRDTARVGEVVDALTKAGAALIGGLSFRVTDEAGARKAALEEAARDARTKAESLATAAGKHVGDPQTIVEDVVASNGFYSALRAQAPFAFGAGAPGSVGELEYYARVTASFRFQ